MELLTILSLRLPTFCTSGGIFEDLTPFQIFSVSFDPNDLSMATLYDTNVKGKQLLLESQLIMQQPGSLRPLRTVRAAFVAYGSSAFKAYPMQGHPAVNVGFLTTKSSDLFTFFC